jgi:DNA-binding XRE family transcriptional regulator
VISTVRESGLESNINQRLTVLGILSETDDILEDIDTHLSLTGAAGRFDSQKQFEQFLAEGTLLNVNRLISGAIGIPQGVYAIFELTPEKVMLVPTTEVAVQETTFLPETPVFELPTQKLLGFWNQAERVLAEDEPPKGTSKYPRRVRIRNAVRGVGSTQEELADELGVDPSTISRWTVNDPDAGRIPNLQNALQLAQAVGSDVEDLFASISKRSKRSATSGSGGGRNPTYRKGAAD